MSNIGQECLSDYAYHLVVEDRGDNLSIYQKRFIKVIDYIDANLDKPIDVDALCAVVHLSKYHFHRQCSGVFGLPVMTIIKLLKLKRAAYQLAYRVDDKLIDIAFNCGYESHEAFSRAFKKVFLVTPSAFRQAPNWHVWQSNYDPIEKLRTNLMLDKAKFDVQIVHFDQVLTATLEHRSSPNNLGQSIAKFIAWRKQNKLPPSKSRTFNLLYDDPNQTPPDEYRFGLCCAVNEPIEDQEHGIASKVIPAGRCAKIRFVGSDDAIGVAVNYLYGQWLAENEHQLRDFPIFFERVSFFPEVAEHEMITDIYLPIE